MNARMAMVLSWAVAVTVALLFPVADVPADVVTPMEQSPSSAWTGPLALPPPYIPTEVEEPSVTVGPIVWDPVRPTFEERPASEEMAPMSVEVPDVPPVEDPEEPEVPDVPVFTPKIDMCFCVDTTGSMGDEIDVVKATIIDVAAAIRNGTPRPDVRFALVIYRDLGDEYVTRVFDFMDEFALAEVLHDVCAQNGGDYQESVSEALTYAVSNVTWDPESNCAVYLIGDAPPHTDYDNGFDYIQAAQDAASIGVAINTIGCSGIEGSEQAFIDIANVTGGSYVRLTYYGSGGGGGGGGEPYADGGCYDHYGGGGGGGCTGTGSSGSGSSGSEGGTGSGTSSDGGSGTGGDADGASEGTTEGTSGNGQTNNLDEVITHGGQGQGAGQGVVYDDTGGEPAGQGS
jgi:hypothetical protein